MLMTAQRWVRPRAPRRGAIAGRRVADDRGQGLVEFLMVVPLLALFVFGIIDMGAAWRNFQVVTNSAREGARMAVVANGATHGEVLQSIDERLESGGLDLGRRRVSIECDAGTGAACFGAGMTGSGTTVNIEYDHTFIFLAPMIRFIGGDGGNFGTVTMQTGIVMRNE